MNFLALDPGTNCGFAFGDGATMRHGVWRLGISGSEHAGLRLLRLRENLQTLRLGHHIDKIVFEESHQMTRGQAARSVHSQLVGVILLFAAEHRIPFRPVNLATVKAFAGGGRYKKPEMMRAAQIKLGLEITDADECDAVWVLAFALAGFPATERKVKARKPRAKRVGQEQLF